MKQITINNKEHFEFEFNLSTVGVDIKHSKVLFMVDSENDVFQCFKCKHIKGQKWTLDIPAGTLKLGVFDYSLHAIVEHYFLEIVKGKVQVLGDKSITVESNINNTIEKDDTILKDTSKKQIQEKHRSNKANTGDDNQKSQSNKKLTEEIVVSNKHLTKNVPDTNTPLTEDLVSTQKRDFNFLNVDDHPYTSLRDNGKSDQKARSVLKRLGILH